MEEPLQISIRDTNPHIVCSLCAGYFIDATTIMECLHTFCRSCIVKYLQSSKFCPQCNIKIHETQPVMHLKPDRVMQDIVFKLVPGLFESEEKRKQEFYKSRGLVKEKKLDDTTRVTPLASVYDNPEGHYFKHDDLICLCLEHYSSKPTHLDFELASLPKKFVRCSVRTCVRHIQQLLKSKLGIPCKYQVDVICNDTVLDWQMTMKHVWLSQWITKPSPLTLFYRLMRHEPSEAHTAHNR